MYNQTGLGIENVERWAAATVGMEFIDRKVVPRDSKAPTPFAKVIEVERNAGFGNANRIYGSSAVSNAILLDLASRVMTDPLASGRRSKYVQVTGVGPDPIADAWAQLYEKMLDDWRMSDKLSAINFWSTFDRKRNRTKNWAQELFFPSARVFEAGEIANFNFNKRTTLAAFFDLAGEHHPLFDEQIVARLLATNGWDLLDKYSGNASSEFRISHLGNHFKVNQTTDIADSLFRRDVSIPRAPNLSRIREIRVSERAVAESILHHLHQNVLCVNPRDLLSFSAQDATIFTLLGLQARRFIAPNPSRARSLYWCTLLGEAAGQAQARKNDTADRLMGIIDACRDGYVRVGCANVSYGRSYAEAKLRVYSDRRDYGALDTIILAYRPDRLDARFTDYHGN